MTILENLKKKAKGNEDRMMFFARNYVISMKGTLRSLKEALESENYHDVGTIVHKSKSLFSSVGLDDFYRLANHIEMGVNKRYSQEVTKEHTKDLIKDIEESLTVFEPYIDKKV